MKASTTTVQNILEGTKQYVIPLFQRSYSWGKDEWATLWNDVKDLYENSDMQHHFVGSIVTIPDTSFPDGVAKYLLIDGQQRITTLIILLSALRDYCRDIIHDEKEANLIHNTFLCNTYYDGSDYLKLSPSGFDYPFFDSKIRMIDIKGNHRINDAYNFFSSSLKRQGIRVPELRRIIVNGLQLVSIVLDADDNPHLVFESLNAKGLPLTQTDLIRNYFLMQMSPAEQEVLYRNIWLKMDSALGDQFEIFIRDFLMYRLGKDIKPADIYITVKKNFQSENVSIILHDMMRLMNLYNWLITPDILEDFELQRAFQRLKKLEVPSINPFILHCLDDFEHGELSRTDLLNCIHIIENFLMRRYVCNLGTAQLHKFFPILHTQANEFGDKFVDGLRFILQSKGYPKDAEFKTYLVQAQLFKAGGHRTSQKTRLLLESIEESYHHKEQVMLSNTTIEHIMPQTLTPDWQIHLGTEWEITRELYLHTLGNLTLTSYNSELSNSAYQKKKILLIESHLEMNRYFRDVETWTQEDIIRRANFLVNRLLKVWPYFGFDEPSGGDPGDSNIPHTLIILGQKFIVGSWRDVLECTLNVLINLDFDEFEMVTKQYPRLIGRDSRHFKAVRQLHRGFYVEVNLSADSIRQFCLQIALSLGLSEQDWIVEVT